MATKDKRKKLILLDVHAIIHRAYHALPDFSNSSGEPTGALYGLCTMLMKIITELDPSYIIACYDLPKKTFRHEAYDAYKAGRAKTDDALVAQLIRSRDIFNAFSIPIYDSPGFEADDLLGTISHLVMSDKKSKKEIQVIIASGDMDTMQLIDDDNVLVYTLKKGINDTILYNEKMVEERFGFKPLMLPDYKGLRGDPSDNIIGIKGIGEKTATTIIVEFGTIEKLYETLAKKDGKEICKKLGLTDRVIQLLIDGEEEALFSKTLATIRRDAPIDFSIPEKTWKETVEKTKMESLFRELEFKSLMTRFNNVHATNNGGEKIEEVKVVENFDIDLMTDAKIALWLLNSENTNPTDDDVLHYRNAQSFESARIIIEKDIKDANLEYVLNNIELPIKPIIKTMEDVGVKVDVEYLNKLSKEYHTELSKLEKEIWAIAGIEFNINSPKQLGETLFDKMGLSAKGLKKSAGGARSTRESELEKLREGNPIIDKIFAYRELQKLLSTYIDTIPTQVADDGRLHATFSQTGTTTGRFSSNNPNLQNIPTRTELGKNIRHAFVAQEGYILMAFDYSQIELRIAALLSQDEYFIKVFKDGKDIHSAVAMKVFGVEEKDVTSEMRRRAKIINFGILYGMGVNALKANLGGERKDAQIFYDNYFAQFPTIAAYLESVKEFARVHGYTTTLFGRRRYFPGIKSSIPFIRAMAERMAINAPIQGTATADVIKIGMKKVYDALEKEGLIKEVRLVLQVHDELVFEVKNGLEEKSKQIIENALKNAIPEEFVQNIQSVPLEVSCGKGLSWGDLK
ncbi:MAG: polymerase [Patescibacteria group bacterium]|nr:polymerase [Patescibacteria group bacterium]